MLSSVFLFLDIGGGELALIMFVALLLFGGDKLPGLARGLGKGIRDFKDASEGVKREINNQIDNFESKKKEEEEAKKETPLIAEHSEDNLDGTAPESAAPIVANTMPISESYAANDQYEEPMYHDGYKPVEYDTDGYATAQEEYDKTYKNQDADTNVSPETVKEITQEQRK